MRIFLTFAYLFQMQLLSNFEPENLQNKSFFEDWNLTFIVYNKNGFRSVYFSAKVGW